MKYVIYAVCTMHIVHDTIVFVCTRVSDTMCRPISNGLQQFSNDTLRRQSGLVGLKIQVHDVDDVT